jgi:hypothetical protein
LPKTPRVELLKLMIDTLEVEPALVAPKAKWGAYEDYYQYYHMSRPAPGGHTATAIVRSIDTGEVSEHTIEFVV